MAVAFADFADSALGAGALPLWVIKLLGDGVDVSRQTISYLKASRTAFYPWHESGDAEPEDNLRRVAKISRDWGVPAFATEVYSCYMWNASAAVNASTYYWHYSSYCTTGRSFGNRTVPDQTFGSCILGWASAATVSPCGAGAGARRR